MRLRTALLALAFAAVPALAQDSAGAEELYEQALALERAGKGGEAVKLYVRAARAGSEKAAKRLGEILAQKTRDAPPQPLIGDFPTKRERERDFR